MTIQIPDWLPTREKHLKIIQHDNGDFQILYGQDGIEDATWFEEPSDALEWAKKYLENSMEASQ